MRKRLFVMILVLIALFSTSVAVVSGCPENGNPPIELEPTSAPITFPIGEVGQHLKN